MATFRTTTGCITTQDVVVAASCATMWRSMLALDVAAGSVASCSKQVRYQGVHRGSVGDLLGNLFGEISEGHLPPLIA